MKPVITIMAEDTKIDLALAKLEDNIRAFNGEGDYRLVNVAFQPGYRPKAANLQLLSAANTGAAGMEMTFLFIAFFQKMESQVEIYAEVLTMMGMEPGKMKTLIGGAIDRLTPDQECPHDFSQSTVCSLCGYDLRKGE